MGIRRPISRLPSNVLKAYKDVVEEVLPSLVPTIMPTVLQSTLVAEQITVNGNYSLVLSDSGKCICGGNGTITVPTNVQVAFPVVTTINIVTEENEFIIKGFNTDVLVYHNNNLVSADWIIPPRTMVQLCKVGTNTWNIQGQNVVRF